MNTALRLPALVRRLFVRLLGTLPAPFRDTFGPGIMDTVAGGYAEARRRGRLAATWFVTATAVDLLITAGRERWRPAWRPAPTREARKREIGTMLDHLIRDLYYAVRALRRAPGFTAVTVITLALGIGANVAIFSVVDAVLLEPLPFAHPDRLVSIRASAPGSDFPAEFGVSEEFLTQYRDAELLEDLGMFNAFGSTLRTDVLAERVRMSEMTLSTFTTFGVRPILGRLPTPEEEDQAALLSYRIWIARFGGDSSVVGRSMEMANEPRTVVGIMGPDFRFPQEETAVWIPLVPRSQPDVGSFYWDLVGRLRPGASPDDLAQQLAPLAARLPERFGGSANYARLMAQHRPVVRFLQEEIVGNVATPLWVLLGTVGVVLLIACANVANLFAVRSESRQRYLAVRQALGASRRRLIGERMVEAGLLATAGAGVGVFIAWVGAPVLLRTAPDVPRLDNVTMNGTTLLYAAGLALVTTFVFGLVPAMRVSAANLATSLRAAGRGSTSRRTRRIGRNGIVVAQTALALVLLVASGLLVRSFAELRDVDPGYDIDDIFTFQVAPTLNGNGEEMARFHLDFMERVAALPGVQSVGVVHELPLDESTSRGTFVPEGAPPDEIPPSMQYTNAGGAYFETMGIQLLRGRLFVRADHETDLGHVILSRAAAERFWPDQDPIGKRLRFASDTTGWETVVGVVEDIHQRNFRESEPELIYLPLRPRDPWAWRVHSPGYVVKTPRAETITGEIRELIRQVDPGAPLYAVHTMKDLAAESMMELSFTMLTLLVAAALALILGAVGLYGVLSYVVTQRTPEIGLRMALGATHHEVRWMVVRQGGQLAAAGVAVGIAAAVVVTRVLDSLLFGVHATDPLTLLGMSGLMVAVALVASYIPAHRASTVDPVQSLRDE